jgi:diguanylate cyclase (GGDEF)-like protein
VESRSYIEAGILLPSRAVRVARTGRVTGYKRRSASDLLTPLIDIGIALTSESDLTVLLERIVTEARRFTNAEAGTLFLREGEVLRFAVVQNDRLTARFGERDMRRRLAEDRLALEAKSLAGYVANSGEGLTLPNAYAIPSGSPYAFDPASDVRNGYRTCSVLMMPLHDRARDVIGVLQLINARAATGDVVPFDPQCERVVRALASQAAVAIRSVRLEDLVFKDPLTGAYNRRYFTLRIEEEAKRHARLGEPMSLVLIDLDDFKPVNDRHGHEAGDQVLREVTRVLMENSRDFSIVTRYGGDEFAVLLINTPKAGALRYASRMKGLVERHVFDHARLTASIGVASMPDDVIAAADLIPVADRALYAAKRLGRNTIQSA